MMTPFKPQYVTGASAYLTAKNAMEHEHKGMLFDVLKLGIPLGARAVALAEHEDRFWKDWQIDEIYHPFESLESSEMVMVKSLSIIHLSAISMLINHLFI
ncbi:hypothetical protein RFI36_07225 [Acinetobacter gerneri]|uniref:Uncharacterized protein n=1 Tax=Acinetobacter gerneri TaxID=202952 RepID=A0AAW8JGK5_9GAMM|nr:hypothetical protein [Acinetobacter gerneri]MDQ9009658.1 hypothetical protein [Acinetobacter gerneri]MDQ9013746.1 hypothetical protein [Acinetobacter gerneri]MDQ9024914.1 hypothetical protein [Acinetobacter gerneri]MDQ9052326.1 hypothetical protein [Acinetobacter gerneri]MDQ9059595.1 hypothetical protein [Acinetobacter gerneri]